MDEEERNYCSLALLLLRIGNPCLRHYFKTQWNAAGKCRPWTDCAQNGADLLRMFKPLPYEKNTVKSGDTSQWDLSLFVKVLLQSRPPFVVAPNLVTALETLKEMRNKLCHSPIPRVKAADFQKSWTDGCNALSLFGATVVDFDKVKQDVQKPWSELLPMMKHCADQDKAILDGLDLINGKLERLQLAQETIVEGHSRLIQGQETIAEGHSRLIQGQETIVEGHSRLIQGQETIVEGHSRLIQGQETITEGHSRLIQGQETIVEGHSRLQQGQETIVEGHSRLIQGQETIVEGHSRLIQGQETIAEGHSRLIQGQETIAEGHSRLQQGQEKVLEELSSLKNVERTSYQSAEKDLSSRALEYTEKLKSSIKKQTDFLLAEEEDKKIRTDDIFTNVTIQRGKKQIKEPEAKKRRYSRRQMDEVLESRTTLKTCSEMFVYPEKDQKPTASGTTNPKSILLIGKGGIGKSLFCRKLVRDWSDDKLFEKSQEKAKVPDFQFVFLLTFRQFLLPEEEKVDLRDMLNKSSLLDEHSAVDEPLLQYIIENPEKLVIILDGYDEYKHREKITGDFETRYPNNPHEKIPVPALLAKIMKGNMLKESVVVVTSRPGEAEELKKNIFDVRCEIQGFSSLQVKAYIEKYFKENESMKKKVIDQVEANAILLSFGHIPVMCYLMCYCIKWYMTESKTTDKLPVTRTELYHQVIKLFIKKHSSSKYEEMEETKVQEILHKLAELAMNLMIEGKYIFEEKEMKKFNFKEEEITNLKASGLLDCCPGVKKSPSEKPPLEYTFTHLTIHEYLCAFSFVEKKEIPKEEETSAVTLEFVAGILSTKNDEKLMEELIENIKPEDVYDKRNQLLTLSCLYEYKDDGFSTRVINNLKHIYCGEDGRIEFSGITDIDCLYISYLLDIVNLINAEQTKQHLTYTQSFIVDALFIYSSSLSASGIRMLCNSLVSISTVTGLMLFDCELDDECVVIISNMLSSTNITDLYLMSNNITNDGLQCLCSVLKTGDCRVKGLHLRGNDKITDECVQWVRQQIPDVEWRFRRI